MIRGRTGAVKITLCGARPGWPGYIAEPFWLGDFLFELGSRRFGGVAILRRPGAAAQRRLELVTITHREIERDDFSLLHAAAVASQRLDRRLGFFGTRGRHERH